MPPEIMPFSLKTSSVVCLEAINVPDSMHRQNLTPKPLTEPPAAAHQQSPESPRLVVIRRASSHLFILNALNLSSQTRPSHFASPRDLSTVSPNHRIPTHHQPASLHPPKSGLQHPGLLAYHVAASVVTHMSRSLCHASE